MIRLVHVPHRLAKRPREWHSPAGALDCQVRVSGRETPPLDDGDDLLLGVRPRHPGLDKGGNPRRLLPGRSHRGLAGLYIDPELHAGFATDGAGELVDVDELDFPRVSSGDAVVEVLKDRWEAGDVGGEENRPFISVAPGELGGSVEPDDRLARTC